MLLKIFKSVAVGAVLALMTPQKLMAEDATSCTSGVACQVLHAGHERGRIPVSCVSIPFEKKGTGQIAMFVLRHYSPDQTLNDQIAEPGNLIFQDSKITGPQDNFCRNAKKFVGAGVVVLCDKENGNGWIKGEALALTIQNGRPPQNGRIHVGIF